MPRRKSSAAESEAHRARRRDAGYNRRDLPWILVPLIALSGALLTTPSRPAPSIEPAAAVGPAPEPEHDGALEPSSSPSVAARQEQGEVSIAATDVGRTERSTSRPEVETSIELYVLEGSSGRRVPEAWVEVGITPSGDDSERIVLRRADDTGRLAMNVEAGFLRVVGWNNGRAGGPLGMELESGEQSRIELTLTPTHAVGGRIVDAATGAPIENASIRFWTFSERDRVLSGPDGTFHHERFPALSRAQQIRVEAEGYGAAVRFLKIEDGGRWTFPAALADGDTLAGPDSPWIEIALARELRIRGRVVDAGTRPVENATVSAEGFFRALPTVASRDEAAVRTDESGAFVLTGLRSDIGHSVMVCAPGFAEHLLEVPSEPAEELDLGEIVLASETLLMGVVVDAESVPVEDIEVVLVPIEAEEEEDETPPSPLDVDVRLAGTEHTTRTTPEGVFLFENLDERSYRLLVLRDRDALLERDVHPVAGEGFRSIELDLPHDSLILRGEVRSPTGSIAGARIEVRRSGLVGRTVADEDGRFRLSGLDGTDAYEILVTAVCPETGRNMSSRALAWAFEPAALVLEADEQYGLAHQGPR